MIENMSTRLTVFHCLCPLPASRKGLRLPLRSALFWRRRQRLEAVPRERIKSIKKRKSGKLFYFLNSLVHDSGISGLLKGGG